MTAESPKVFISYSHDSATHRDRVLAFANRLLAEGIDCRTDREHEDSPPPKGWPHWMLDSLDWAEFVLVICTETYYQRFRGHAPKGKGKGVKWEGAIISQELYENELHNLKYVPVLFDATHQPHIPEPLRPTDHYVATTDQGYERLYRRITKQKRYEAKPPGDIRQLPPEPAPDEFITKSNAPFMAEPLGDFVQRPKEFDALIALLLNQQRTTPVAITAALRGAGGFGKTTLARALCHDGRVRAAFPDGILWATLGERPENLLGQIEDLIYTLDGQRPGFTNIQSASNRLKELLAQREALLVIDDVWNNVHLTPFLQGGARCAHLITTRNSDTLPAAAQQVKVDAMLEDEAVAMLGAGIQGTDEQAKELSTLAKRLGEWPLLLKLVNGTLRERIQNTNAGLPDALKYVNTALTKRGLTFFDVRNAEARHQAVARTIGVSLELLTDAERARYNELAAFPEDVEIPLPTLESYWGLDDFETEELCARLMQLSLLLSFDTATRRIRLHDVFRHYLIGEQSDQMPALHTKLLAAHRPISPSPHLPISPWSQLRADDPYWWEHLAYHLTEAGRGAEFVATVKDWRYLAQKTLLRKSFAVESDLLRAEAVAPDDDPLKTLRRNFVNTGHLFNRCQTRDEIEATLNARFQHLRELKTMVQDLAEQLRRPFATPQFDLPDLPHPALIRTLTGHSAGVNGCAFSPDGARIVSASYDNTLKVWDALSGQELRSLTGHSSGVSGCAFSPDGRRIVSASGDKTLKVWDALSGQELRSLTGHSAIVYGCAFSPDGRRIVSASYDSTLKVWDALSGQELRSLTGHSAIVYGCAFSPDGARIVSASHDHTLKVWDALSGQELRSLTGHSAWVSGCAFSPDGARIVSASWDKTLKVWDAQTGQELRTLTGHSDTVSGCAFSPDGACIVSASGDKTLKVWDAQTGQELRSLTGHSSGVSGCAFSPDGARIVSASSDQTLKVWDALTGQELRSLTGHSWFVYGCAFSPDGACIVSASHDQTLKVWDAQTGQELRSLTGHSSYVNDCAFSPDGARIVSASYDNTLKVWDALSGQELRSLTGHSSGVSGCAFSPDGARIVSASHDHTLKVWDALSGQELRSLTGHSEAVRGCAFSPDGRRIVSASDDQTLKVWDALTGQCLTTFQADAGLYCCAFSPDGRWIVAGGDNGVYWLKLVQ